jgi:DNA primase
LVSTGQRGNYDRFRGRLVWPIRDLAGDVVGFGARRLLDTDQGPKYLNTPETPLYKKSHVLYGIDLARKDISKQQRAVVVEGYTDVMACHVAGVTTAIATCGTSFGADHVKMLRRLLLDTDAMTGAVVFTFDGDAAGQRAALRAFESDQAFVAQTYVAVEPSGMDPCELRLASGDAAVRQLVESRVPMFEFAMRARLGQHDLDTAEGRVAALRDTAPLVSSIRDQALRSEYLTSLGGWLGMDPESVRDTVRAAARQAGARPGPTARPENAPAARSTTSPDHRLEAQAVQVMLQYPQLVREWIRAVESTAFTDPRLRSVFAAIAAVGPPGEGDTRTDREWLDDVMAAAVDDGVRADIRGWAVLGLPLGAGADIAIYADSVMAKLQSGDVTRRIAPLKGRLARSDPTRDAAEFTQLMAELMELETYRRQLQDQSQGGGE